MELKALYAQLRHVITVKVIDKKLSHYDFKYINTTLEEKIYAKWYHRLIFKKTIVATSYEGYYEDYYGTGFTKYHQLRTAQELRDAGYLVDDIEKLVYDKPRVEFRFSNKDSFDKRFETIQELESFLQPLLNKNKELIRIM